MHIARRGERGYLYPDGVGCGQAFHSGCWMARARDGAFRVRPAGDRPQVRSESGRFVDRAFGGWEFRDESGSWYRGALKRRTRGAPHAALRVV